MRLKRYDEHDDEHAKNPAPGDYWHDCFAPCFCVVDVGPFHVSVLDKTIETDSDHWTWDVSKVTTMTRAAFNERVRYRGLSGCSKSAVADKCWCNVAPRAHIEFVQAALEQARVKP